MTSLCSTAAPDCRTGQSKGRYCARIQSQLLLLVMPQNEKCVDSQNFILPAYSDRKGTLMVPALEMLEHPQQASEEIPNEHQTNLLRPLCFGYRISPISIQGNQRPFKYYVSMFLAFLGPPTHLRQHKQFCKSEKLPFSDPTHPPLC